MNAEDPLITNDDLYLARLVTDATENEGVLFAYITDTDGVFRAHSNIEMVGKKTEIFNRPENIYKVTLPVFLAGEKRIGSVTVGLDTERIDRVTNKMQIVLASISVVGLLAGILGTIMLSNYLTNPIKQLVEGVRAISRGDFDQEIDTKTNDEIGDLTRAFNRMAKSLKEKELIKDAFRKYVSVQVAEEIFRNPDRYIETLKGVRRKVTILFADIRGFTPLSEKLPAEKVVSLLNTVLTEMSKSIFKYEGTIDKFLGDGLMAFFGAPISHPDDIDRAVRAGIDIQKSITLANIEMDLDIEKTIEVGIGITTGEVVVGNIGTDERLDYTVVGDYVNLASRLEGIAQGGEIIVTDDVYANISKKYRFSKSRDVMVKGKKQPVKVYSILFK